MLLITPNAASPQQKLNTSMTSFTSDSVPTIPEPSQIPDLDLARDSGLGSPDGTLFSKDTSSKDIDLNEPGAALGTPASDVPTSRLKRLSSHNESIKWGDAPVDALVAPAQLEENLYTNSESFVAEPLGMVASVKPPVSFCIRPFPQDKLSTLPLQGGSRVDYDCSNFECFHQYDEHARLIAQKEHTRLRELLWDLVFSRNIKGNVERARVLFTYVCSLPYATDQNADPKSFNFQQSELLTSSMRPTDPEMSPTVFKQQMRAGKTHHARVLQRLCTYSNLPCLLVEGVARGPEYAPGDSGQPEHLRHWWNLVYFNNQWYPIDCNWASQRGPKLEEEEEGPPQLENLYFLTNPSYFIHSHFPNEQSHQLLARPLSVDEFHQLPLAHPKFFQHHLLVKSHKRLICPVAGEGRLEITCPESSRLSFAASFVYVASEAQSVPLNKYVMHERESSKAVFSLRIPRTGFYMLTLYASEYKDNGSPGEVPILDTSFNTIIEYCIAGKAPREILLPPYPPCQALQWGPNFAAKHFAKVFNPSAAYIQTSTGAANLEIDSEPKVKYIARMTHSRLEKSKKLEEHVLCRHVGEKVVITATLPAEGEFGLDVFATRSIKHGHVSSEDYVHVAQFIIASTGPFLKQGKFPRLPSGLLGSHSSPADRVLIPDGNLDPYVTTRTGQVDLPMKITMPEDNELISPELIQVMTKLQNASSGTVLENQVLLQCKNDLVMLKANLLEPGMYLLHVFAEASGYGLAQPVFVYLVNAQQVRTPIFPFPKMFPRWANSGCSLLSPTRGTLSTYKLRNSVHFRLVVPEALKVVVTIGANWHNLNKKQDQQWEGIVPMLHYWKKEKKLIVGACFPDSEPGSFASLLEYRL